MYSMITLSVGRFEVDWTRDGMLIRDHRALYQASDFGQIPCYYLDPHEDTIDYDFDEERPTVVGHNDGFSKPFKDVLDRINLLGHSYENCKNDFLELARIHDFNPAEFRLEDLEDAVQKIDVTQISADYGDGHESFGKFFCRYIVPRFSLSRWENSPSMSNFSEAMENLDPWNVLQLLSRNPTANELSVNWDISRFWDVPEYLRANMFEGLNASNRFLIVTEGSSDTKVIKKGFDSLMPHIADFFEYVDMEEGYPFSGTGNLLNFVRGLISISIQNNVIIIFDNDTEGLATYNRCMELNIPGNMRVIKLPDRPEFCSFKVIGPNGTHKANINGRAAAIECYLDLDENACVRWSSFNRHTNSYQGELVDKQKYLRDFLKQRAMNIGYDYSRITSVLDAICEECHRIKDNRDSPSPSP